MRLAGLLLALLSGTAFADHHADGGGELLQRMATAIREQSFSGTFVYQRGDFSETSRIVHRGDAAGGSDRIETLSGRPREVIRTGQDVTWYLPESRTIRTERHSSRRFFPDLFAADRARTIAQFYDISRNGSDRVAGLECNNFVLTPKDGLRYPQNICVESHSWLPLRVVTFNERQERLESIAFSQLQMLGQVDPAELKAKLNNTAAWTQEAAPGASGSGWIFRELPAGFAEVSEHQRSMPGRSAPVIHKVLSDGMVWVSVFIEPTGNQPAMGRGLTQQGGANAYTRPVGTHHVTAIGLVPVKTLVLIGNALTLRGSSP